MSIPVVILSKTESNILPCVAALREHEPTARPIIVDDGIQSDKPDEWWYEWTLRNDVTWVDGDSPFVFAVNANKGLRAAFEDADVEGAFLVNDDALLTTPGGFSVIARAAKEHTEYGIIASTCNNVGNPAQFPQGIGLREDPRMVCFVTVYLPRSTFENVGPLDEAYTKYGLDDDDLCFRIRRAGLKIGIHDGCYMDHGSLKSTFRGDPKAPACFNHNMEIYKRKWGEDNFGRKV